MTPNSTQYSEEVVEEICERVMEGESVRSITGDQHMPNFTTVWKWTLKHPEFKAALDEARLIRVEAVADEVMEAARVGTGDVARDRLIVDTIKWEASKWLKKYADRIQHTGADGGPIKFEDMNANDIMARIAFLKRQSGTGDDVESIDPEMGSTSGSAE